MKGARVMGCCAASLLAVCLSATAAAPVEGLWQQVDDDGKVNSLVRLEIVGGQLQATIVKGYPRDGVSRDPDEHCVHCEGDLKDKPLVGMRFLWGLTGDGTSWTDGHIVDPSSGMVYRAKASLSDDGQQLLVRGYLGVSLFGRTQVWRRNPGEHAG